MDPLVFGGGGELNRGEEEMGGGGLKGEDEEGGGGGLNGEDVKGGGLLMAVVCGE